MRWTLSTLFVLVFVALTNFPVKHILNFNIHIFGNNSLQSLLAFVPRILPWTLPACVTVIDIFLFLMRNLIIIIIIFIIHRYVFKQFFTTVDDWCCLHLFFFIKCLFFIICLKGLWHVWSKLWKVIFRNHIIFVFYFCCDYTWWTYL